MNNTPPAGKATGATATGQKRAAAEVIDAEEQERRRKRAERFATKPTAAWSVPLFIKQFSSSRNLTLETLGLPILYIYRDLCT